MSFYLKEIFLFDLESPREKWCVSTVPDLARFFFRTCSTLLEVCFDIARGLFRICARPKPQSRLFFFVRARTLKVETKREQPRPG